MRRRFVIGDVHGSAKALQEVLDLVDFNYEEDLLISLGDIADGWGEVPECVEILLKVKNLIAVRGNHDVWCHNWFKTGESPIIWTQQGGQATIDAYVRTGLLGDPRHKAFWDNQVNWYIDDEKRLFIHAGFPFTDNGDFVTKATTKVNAGEGSMECHWDRDLYYAYLRHDEKALPNTLKAATEEFSEIFIGHTAVTYPFQPFVKEKLRNLDTGCGWNGLLTIWNIDTKEYFQSELSKKLYPNEKGRR